MNAIMCKKCNDIIQSVHRHDFQTCSCGAVSVDGGDDYLRRCGDANSWIEVPSMSVKRRLEATHKSKEKK